LTIASAAAARIVLDTNVVSFQLKQDTRALLYQPLLVGRVAVVSFMTIAELALWAELYRWGERKRAHYERLLASYVEHYPDRRTCETWSSIIAHGRATGANVDRADAWIAATAMVLGCPVVTHNPRDFSRIRGLSVISALSGSPGATESTD
jgi:tRNA(fMet)-specific endonuclease VapC